MTLGPGQQPPQPGLPEYGLSPEMARLHERFGTYATAIHDVITGFHGPYTGEAYRHHEFLGVGLVGSHEDGPNGESWLVKVAPRRAHIPAMTSYDDLAASANAADETFREWSYSSTQPGLVLSAGLGQSEVNRELVHAMRRTAISVARAYDNEEVAARLEEMDED